MGFTNSKWADPVGLVGGEWVAPDGVTSIFDIVAVNEAFRGLESAPAKMRVDFLGVDQISGPTAVLDAKITVSELVAVLSEFETGAGYPFLPGGSPCP